MWKVFGGGGWVYFEADEIDHLIAMMTEAAIHHEFNRSTAGNVASKRRRLRAWFMRGRPDGYDEERSAGLHRTTYGPPKVHALVGDEWVQVGWRLIEPTVQLDPFIQRDGSKS